MTIAQIRSAFGTALRTIPGLNVDDYIVEAVRPPHAMLDWYCDNPHVTLGGCADEYRFLVHLYAQRSAADPSQKALDLLRDPQAAAGIGVMATVEASSAVSAVVDYARVRDIAPITVVTVGSADYLMSTIEFEVVV